MSEPMIEPVRREDAPIYVLRGGAYLLDEHAGVLIDSAGNFSTKTKGDPRALAVLLRAIAEDIEDDIGAHPDDAGREEDPMTARCNRCGRITYEPGNVNTEDRMTQPDGNPCGGRLVPESDVEGSDRG